MSESLLGEASLSDLLLVWTLRIATTLAILVVGWLVTKLVVRLASRYLAKREVDELLIRFVASVTNITLLVIVIIAALSSLGINATSLVALLGAAGVAVGLALQDSLKNFASGVLLIFYRPFGVGDYVEAGDAEGIVEKIDLFSTILRTPDNKEVIVPNGAIYNDTITNYSARPIRRVDMVFGIGYDDDIHRARELIQQLLEADDRVLEEPEPVIAVSELADSSVNFDVLPWVKTEDYLAVKFDLTEKVKLAFDEHGISIPYPQMDIHLNGSN